MGMAARFAEPVVFMMMLDRRVPKKEAPLPKISRMPNRHPDWSAGMILAK